MPNSALDADVTFVIFTFAEGNIAIAAACMPLIASQWRYLSRRFETSRNKRSDDDYISLNPRLDAAPRNTPDMSYDGGQMYHGSQESTVQEQDSAKVMDQSYTNTKRDVDVERNQ